MYVWLGLHSVPIPIGLDRRHCPIKHFHKPLFLGLFLKTVYYCVLLYILCLGHEHQTTQLSEMQHPPGTGNKMFLVFIVDVAQIAHL